jgi:hypothetical protein
MMLGPIFTREALTVPRHVRHYRNRVFYLGTLWVLGLTAWQAMFGWGRTVSTGDLAYFGTVVFQLLVFSQLVLVLFFSALFAAGAVAQEKDRRTFILLLVTDLRHHEIVLGKLLGSLLEIGAVVLGSIGLLCLILLLGGVAVTQVVQAAAVLGASALAAGSLGCLVALWRDRTFQTLSMTVLFLVLYFLVVEGLRAVAWLAPATADDVAAAQNLLSPFRMLGRIIQPPVGGDLGRDTLGFVGLMLGLSVAMNLVGIVNLRRWNPRGEPIQKPDTEDKDADEALDNRRNVHAAPGKVREVRGNPLLWREVFTRAYGHRPLLTKLIYLLVVSAIAFWAMSDLAPPERANRLIPAFGLVPVTVLALVLLNAQAVTAITSERDLGALELLLVTELTPQEFIFGKLGGIVFNTKEILLPPLILLGLYAWWGYIPLETLIYMVLGLFVLMAFTAVLGLHVALRTVNTRTAILNSLGTIFFLSIGTMLCIYLILIGGRFEYQWLSFSFFLLAGTGGLWLVLGGQQGSPAVAIAAWVCPFAMFYAISNILIGNPGTGEAGDPLLPFLVIVGAFGFTILAMLVPMLSEFQVALAHNQPAVEE